MKAKRIRMGVSGLGRIGWKFHCKEISEHREFELAAVADPSAERRREAEAAYGCRAFPSYAHMISEAELDAVVVASPTHLHKAQAVAALRKGLHVLLEKPMALDLAEAQVVVRAARRAKRVLTVYQPHRLRAYFQQLLRILRSGKLGTIYHVRLAMFDFERRDDWQSLRKYGGGILNNYGAHALDQILALLGHDVRRVFCNRRIVATLGDAEDVVKVVCETRDGAVGEVDINQASPVSPFGIVVHGSRGVLTSDRKAFTVRRIPARGLKPKKLNKSLAAANRQYPSDDVRFLEEIIPVDEKYKIDVYKDFARAVRTGAAPYIRPEETLAVMSLIEACRKDSPRIFEARL
ncbi:MAG: Gfo/Idh/MocA family oxidoreductase [Planctomycetota bacterium]